MDDCKGLLSENETRNGTDICPDQLLQLSNVCLAEKSREEIMEISYRIILAMGFHVIFILIFNYNQRQT